MSNDEIPKFRNPDKLQVLPYREWMRLNLPTGKQGMVVEDLDAVQLSVQRGATPDQVRTFVLRRCGTNRVEFARRCESASRHLWALKENS